MSLDDQSEMTGAALTPRERQVLDLARRGLTNKVIASELGISRNAVRFHLKEIHSKLDTGGERQVLGQPRRRALALLVWPAAKAGLPLSIAMFGAAIVSTAYVAYRSLPDDAAHALAPERFQGVVLVDGRYPNGCPAEFSAGSMTLADFAYGSTTLSQLRALNPSVPDGPLPPKTIIRVPYDPEGTCGEAVVTPAGSNATASP